jgi:hypothetical protein
MPFGPRSPFASRRIGPTPYRLLPDRTATYEQTPSKQRDRAGSNRCDGFVPETPALEGIPFAPYTTSVDATFEHPCGTSSRRCCPSMWTATRWAATTHAFRTASCSSMFIAALVHGSGYERVASPGCSDRTIRRRVKYWSELGMWPSRYTP